MAAVEAPLSPAANASHATIDSLTDGAPSDAGASSEPVTVFHDPNNFNVKHPLAHAWTLWFTKPPRGGDNNWNDLLKEVISFDSVEEFWSIYNNIILTSDLPPKADFHLFKKGVRPEWEDPQNKSGGKWAYTSKEKKGVPIDDLWLNVLLAAIGESLEDDDDGEVMGVVCNVRGKFYRLGLWTKSSTSTGKGERKDILIRIGNRFKESLGLPPAEQVEFTGHTESATSGSTRAKAKLVV